MIERCIEDFDISETTFRFNGLQELRKLREQYRIILVYRADSRHIFIVDFPAYHGCGMCVFLELPPTVVNAKMLVQDVV